MPEGNVEALWYLYRPGYLHHAKTASSILQCMRSLCSTVRVDGAQAGKAAYPLSSLSFLVLQDYRCWLDHWRTLCSVLTNLKSRGHPGNNYGSAPRRQLYASLKVLVDLGAAEYPTALYPSQLPSMLLETNAVESLLALLDDESYHLVGLALRCLGDLAANPAVTCRLREAVQERFQLFQSFLDGSDIDLVEATP